VVVRGKLSNLVVKYLLDHSATFAATYKELDQDVNVHLTIHDPEDEVQENLPIGYDPDSHSILFNVNDVNQANLDLPRNSSWIFTAALSWLMR
jgi:hypothetical protein